MRFIILGGLLIFSSLSQAIQSSSVEYNCSGKFLMITATGVSGPFAYPPIATVSESACTTVQSELVRYKTIVGVHNLIGVCDGSTNLHRLSANMNGGLNDLRLEYVGGDFKCMRLQTQINSHQ